MSKHTRRRLAALILGAGVLASGGCLNGDVRGHAYYGSDVSVGYVHYGSGCGRGNYGDLIFLGILGGIALFQGLFRCH